MKKNCKIDFLNFYFYLGLAHGTGIPSAQYLLSMRDTKVK